jgi:hypothetical protein
MVNSVCDCTLPCVRPVDTPLFVKSDVVVIRSLCCIVSYVCSSTVFSSASVVNSVSDPVDPLRFLFSVR